MLSGYVFGMDDMNTQDCENYCSKEINHKLEINHKF